MKSVEQLTKEVWSEQEDVEEVLEFFKEYEPEKKEFRSRESLLNFLTRELRNMIGNNRPEPYGGYWKSKKMALSNGINKEKHIVTVIKLVTGKCEPARNKQKRWGNEDLEHVSDPFKEERAMEEKNYTS